MLLKLKSSEKSTKAFLKSLFLNNLGLCKRKSSQEKKFFKKKSRLFWIKKLDKIPTREPTPEKAAEPAAEQIPKISTEPTPKLATEVTSIKDKKSKLKLQQEFMNEIIAGEKDINNEIFLNYFKCQNPWILIKGLISAKQNKNEKLVIMLLMNWLI